MSDPMRPRAALRTAVVWDVLQDALERRVKATGRQALDVLDTGGGSGNFAVPLARLGHRVTVVDPSPNALFALERRAAEEGVADRVRGVQGDARGLFDVAERGGYDVVLCHGVLGTSTTRRRACATPWPPCAPAGSSACSPRAWAARCSPVPSPGTSQRPGRPSATRTADGATATPCRAASPPTSSPRWCAARGLEAVAVHGVRVFSDLVPGVLVDTEPGAMEALLKLEAAAPSSPPSTPWPRSSMCSVRRAGPTGRERPSVTRR